MAGMGVAEQHSHVPMAGNRCDFGDRQPKLEQPGNRFVPEVVKIQILYLGSLGQSIPCKPKGDRRGREQPAVLLPILVAHPAYGVGQQGGVVSRKW